MSHSAQVLVLDSGVGALSIIAEIRRQLPGVSITYASDNGFFPYGTKPEAALIDRVRELMGQLLEECQPDLAVVACNTASTVALPAIRQHFDLPIVGVVPAIKPAAALSRTRTLGLIATPGTIARRYTAELIETYAADCEIIALGSAELVALAEAKVCGEAVDPAAISRALQPMLEDQRLLAMDTAVLACTHFPLLKEEIAARFSPSVQWLDSGNAIAKRVAHLLESQDLAVDGPARYRSLFTAATRDAERLAERLPEHLPGPVDYITLA